MIIFLSKTLKINKLLRIPEEIEYVDSLNGYSLEQLNKIPQEGYSNNLIWNIGHTVVVQQMLVYKLSGLPMMIHDEMVSKYKKKE
jgi:hypothetical protein